MGSHEVVVNSCRSASRFADETLRAEIDGDKVSARNRRVERCRHRIAALADRQLKGNAVGVKEAKCSASFLKSREEDVEIAARDRLSDCEAVVARWRRNYHPV